MEYSFELCLCRHDQSLVANFVGIVSTIDLGRFENVDRLQIQLNAKCRTSSKYVGSQRVVVTSNVRVVYGIDDSLSRMKAEHARRMQQGGFEKGEEGPPELVESNTLSQQRQAGKERGEDAVAYTSIDQEKPTYVSPESENDIQREFENTL